MNFRLFICLFLLSCSANKELLRSPDGKLDCGVLITKRIDAFNNDSFYSSPYYFKIKGQPKMRSYLNLVSFEDKQKKKNMSVIVDNFIGIKGMNGLQLTFEDGIKLNKDCKIYLEYYSVLNLFYHIGTFEIDENEILRFKNTLVTRIKIGKLEVLVSKEEGERFKQIAECMMEI